MSKRLVKLRGTEKFRRVGNRTGGKTDGESINWASCKKIQYNQYRAPGNSGSGFALTSGETKFLWAAATFVLSAPLIAAYATGAAVAGAAQFAATQSGIGAGLLTALNLNNFLSKNIETPKTPKVMKFSKPCIGNPGGFSTNNLKAIPLKNRFQNSQIPAIRYGGEIIGTIIENLED